MNETQEQFCARMRAAQDAAFEELCSKGALSKMLASAPTSDHADALRGVLSAVFDAGAGFGVRKMLGELDEATRVEL